MEPDGAQIAVDWRCGDGALWRPDKVATLLFVFDGAGRVLLIHKKRGLGRGKINGPGGRLEPGETPVQAAVRETREELGIAVADPRFCGSLRFQFTDGYALHGHVFKTTRWTGEPVETDEAIPEWFPVDAIPYDRMWEDDRHWFPLMLAGTPFSGRFIFDGETMRWMSLEPGFDEEDAAVNGVSTSTSPGGETTCR